MLNMRDRILVMILISVSSINIAYALPLFNIDIGNMTDINASCPVNYSLNNIVRIDNNLSYNCILNNITSGNITIYFNTTINTTVTYNYTINNTYYIIPCLTNTTGNLSTNCSVTINVSQYLCNNYSGQVSSIGADFYYGDGSYYIDAYNSHQVRIYAYKIVNSVKIYNPNYIQSDVFYSTDSYSSNYYIYWYWTAAPDADGYIVVQSFTDNYIPENSRYYTPVFSGVWVADVSTNELYDDYSTPWIEYNPDYNFSPIQYCALSYNDALKVYGNSFFNGNIYNYGDSINLLTTNLNITATKYNLTSINIYENGIMYRKPLSTSADLDVLETRYRPSGNVTGLLYVGGFERWNFYYLTSFIGSVFYSFSGISPMIGLCQGDCAQSRYNIIATTGGGTSKFGLSFSEDTPSKTRINIGSDNKFLDATLGIDSLNKAYSALLINYTQSKTTDIFKIVDNSGYSTFYIDKNNLTQIDKLNVSRNTTLNNVVITGNLSVKRPYGMYSDNTTQLIAATGTAYPINFSITEDDYLIVKNSNKQNFTFSQTGDYLIELSAVFTVTSGSNKHIEIWIQKNGINIPRSNTKIEIPNSGIETVVSVPFIIDMTTTDTFRIMWASDTTNAQLLYTTNTSYSPETPSIIMTISKISELT